VQARMRVAPARPLPHATILVDASLPGERAAQRSGSMPCVRIRSGLPYTICLGPVCFPFQGGIELAVTADRYLLPKSEFLPDNTDMIRGLDANPDTVPFDFQHCEGDVTADDELLASLSAQYQHLAPP